MCPVPHDKTRITFHITLQAGPSNGGGGGGNSGAAARNKKAAAAAAAEAKKAAAAAAEASASQQQQSQQPQHAYQQSQQPQNAYQPQHQLMPQQQQQMGGSAAANAARAQQESRAGERWLVCVYVSLSVVVGLCVQAELKQRMHGTAPTQHTQRPPRAACCFLLVLLKLAKLNHSLCACAAADQLALQRSMQGQGGDIVSGSDAMGECCVY